MFDDYNTKKITQLINISKKKKSFLQSISHAKCYEEFLVKGRHPLLMDRPIQNAT